MTDKPARMLIHCLNWAFAVGALIGSRMVYCEIHHMGYEWDIYMCRFYLLASIVGVLCFDIVLPFFLRTSKDLQRLCFDWCIPQCFLFGLILIAIVFGPF